MEKPLGVWRPTYGRLPREHRPQAAITDWDRTMGRVEASLSRLYVVAQQHNVDVSEVKAEYQQSKLDGGSMEPVTIIEKRLQQAGISSEQTRQAYLQVRPRNRAARVIYPDAPGYVTRLRRADMPEGVATYGVSQRWQEAYKIAGGEYDGHVQTLGHTHKVPYAFSLFGPEGTADFLKVVRGHIQSLVCAETIAVVDDKNLSLQGADNERVFGWLLRRPEELELPSQKGKEPWPEEYTVPSLGHLAVEHGIVTRVDEPFPDWPPRMPQGDTQYVPVIYPAA